MFAKKTKLEYMEKLQGTILAINGLIDRAQLDLQDVAAVQGTSAQDGGYEAEYTQLVVDLQAARATVMAALDKINLPADANS